MGTISDDCLAQVQTFLSHRSNVDIARVSREAKPRFSLISLTGYVDYMRCRRALIALSTGPCTIASQRQACQWCLRLLSRICKARSITSTSYILPLELMHVGRVRSGGGFADVSDGEYLGRLVAIKRLESAQARAISTKRVKYLD